MQNLNENKSQFSSPCVDNSPKNGDKTGSNIGVITENIKNDQKSTDFKEKTDTSLGFSSDLNNNLGVFKENTEIQPENIDFSNKNTEIQANNNSLLNNTTNKQETSENETKNNDSTSLLTFEEVIERDFEDFALIYPNISKKSLLESENLKIFAEGKESKPISVTYAKYRKFVDSIASEAVLQEKSRQANNNSATGPLASNQNTNAPYFTREQVKNMTPSEVKKNYEIIRKSQANW